MANNCLVTKLKASVNNNELPYVGYIKAKILSTPTNNLDLSVDYNAVINDVIKKNGVDISSISSNEIRASLSCVQDDVFAIPQKYKATYFSLVFPEGHGLVDAAIDLSYCTSLTKIGIKNITSFDVWAFDSDTLGRLTEVTCMFDSANTKPFTISKLCKFTSLTKLNLFNAKTTGNIMDLVGACKNMVDLNLMSNQSLEGDLSEFAQALYTAGKTSTLKINLTNDEYITLPSGVTLGTVYISFDNQGYHISNTNPNA